MSGTYSKKASNGKKEDTKFSVVIPRTETELDSLISLLDENGTKINVVNDAERNQLLNFIVSLLPYLILFGGMFFFLKMMSNTAGAVSYTHLDVYKRQRCQCRKSLILSSC